MEGLEALGKRIIELSKSVASQVKEAAVKELRLPVDIVDAEIQYMEEDCNHLAQLEPQLKGQEPLCKEGEEIAILLPYNGALWQLMPTLAMLLPGNTVRVKFSSRCSEISEIVEMVLKTLFGDRVIFDRRPGKEVLPKLISDPKVKGLFLYGDDRHVFPYADLVKEHRKRVIFEGPGNDPTIICPLADLDLAVENIAKIKFYNSGQACVAPERIYVHESLYEEFLDRIVEKTRHIKVGSPEEPGVEVTEIPSHFVVQRTKEHLEDALSKGARIIFGGKIEGNTIYPTVVADCNDSMRCLQEEAFSPVLYVTCYRTTDGLIPRVKKNRYGLAASVFGLWDAVHVAGNLQGKPYLTPVSSTEPVTGLFGMVNLNGYVYDSILRPFGGYGYSGWVWDCEGDEFGMFQGPKLWVNTACKSLKVHQGVDLI